MTWKDLRWPGKGVCLWIHCPVRPLWQFDSLTLKTHFISLWRASKMHFSCLFRGCQNVRPHRHTTSLRPTYEEWVKVHFNIWVIPCHAIIIIRSPVMLFSQIWPPSPILRAIFGSRYVLGHFGGQNFCFLFRLYFSNFFWLFLQWNSQIRYIFVW